jgi:V8-like Glu-specific endopeptidase
MPAPLRLQGTDLGRFRDLLLAAFTRARFAELLLTRLNRSIGTYAAPVDNDPTAVLNVLVGANAELWWRDLLREARNAVPNDPNLQAFEEEYGQAAQAVAVDKQGRRTIVSGSALEVQIKKAQSTFNILPWRKKVGEIETRVCRLEYPETQGLASGFLVAPDLVMTNYHVIEEFLKTPALVDQIVVRFDYKVLDDGISINSGKTYKLATKWLVETTPYSDHDNELAPTGEPAAGELDFALLRIQGTPGKDPVGGDTNDPHAVARGWIAVKPTLHDFVANPAIYIVQHPDCKPMQIAIDADAVVGVAKNGTRVKYTTTTEPGSSGSPCFSANWELVALHHAGDPKYYAGLKPEFNQGIPINAIWNWAKEKGYAGLFEAA